MLSGHKQLGCHLRLGMWIIVEVNTHWAKFMDWQYAMKKCNIVGLKKKKVHWFWDFSNSSNRLESSNNTPQTLYLHPTQRLLWPPLTIDIEYHDPVWRLVLINPREVNLFWSMSMSWKAGLCHCCIYSLYPDLYTLRYFEQLYYTMCCTICINSEIESAKKQYIEVSQNLMRVTIWFMMMRDVMLIICVHLTFLWPASTKPLIFQSE